MKRILWIGSIIAIFIIGVILVLQSGTSKERVSEQFAAHLFNYPLPAETSLITKYQFNGKNFIDGGGSGGYWNVVAIIALSSTLTRQEILAYYQGIEPFPYPKGKRAGVELEIYFEDNNEKVIIPAAGFYFRDKDKRMRTISTYLEEPDTQANQASATTKYFLQIASGFDYFLNID
ncbi:hypothetical protein AB4Z50_15070 [Paenibacillus sp. 2TAB26]|uniref:hypothetical protein n=1 Tax=Paenibacillus sp. 2TAB26 TaxID=3233005 RepID=UPI003F9DCCFC